MQNLRKISLGAEGVKIESIMPLAGLPRLTSVYLANSNPKFDYGEVKKVEAIRGRILGGPGYPYPPRNR